MHVLVYERVLRDDDEFQLAHADWIVQVPDLRWRSNSDAHTDADTDTNSDTYADTNSDTSADTDSNPDACAVAGRTHKSGWDCGIFDSGQLVVDR